MQVYFTSVLFGLILLTISTNGNIVIFEAFAAQPVAVMKSIKVPIIVDNEIEHFILEIEPFELNQETWFVKVQSEDVPGSFAKIESAWEPLGQDFKTWFNNSVSVANQTKHLLTAYREVSINVALSTTKGTEPKWNEEVDYSCCRDWIRPQNQTTIVLSGIVSEKVSTNYDKIHITSGTIINTTIYSYWEVTLEDSIKFIFEFYGVSSSSIGSHHPIFLSNTTATILWQESAPQFQPLRQTINLVTGGYDPENIEIFRSVESDSSKANCSVRKINQAWDTRYKFLDPVLQGRFTPDCVIKCAEIYDYFDVILYAAIGISGLVTVICLLVWFKKTESSPYLIKVHWFWMVVTGVNFVFGVITTAFLTALFFYRAQDPYCPKFNDLRFWGMWIAPSAFFGFVGLALVVWLLMSHIAYFLPERSYESLEKKTPAALAQRFYGFLVLAICFLWTAVCVPGLITWLYRDTHAEGDFVILIMWMITCLPTLGGLLLICFLLLGLACCKVGCIIRCFQQTYDQHELDESRQILARDSFN